MPPQPQPKPTPSLHTSPDTRAKLLLPRARVEQLTRPAHQQLKETASHHHWHRPSQHGHPIPRHRNPPHRARTTFPTSRSTRTQASLAYAPLRPHAPPGRTRRAHIHPGCIDPEHHDTRTTATSIVRREPVVKRGSPSKAARTHPRQRWPTATFPGHPCPKTTPGHGASPPAGFPTYRAAAETIENARAAYTRAGSTTAPASRKPHPASCTVLPLNRHRIGTNPSRHLRAAGNSGHLWLTRNHRAPAAQLHPAATPV